jgi:hypothetical protein
MREKLLDDDKRKLQSYIKERKMRNGINDLSLIDQEVLASPEKLMYKYSPTDVSPEIVDLLFNGLTLEQVEPYFNSVIP